MRGEYRRHAGDRGTAPGTTSACAENTIHGGEIRGLAWNYLRVRGEYSTKPVALLFEAELPPRARRIHATLDECAAKSRTTSACAENTIPDFPDSLHGGNYLRVRGEYKVHVVRRHALLELPPRARRIQSRAGLALIACGTTSACAENTPAGQNQMGKTRNYLRVRGEYGAKCLSHMVG